MVPFPGSRATSTQPSSAVAIAPIVAHSASETSTPSSPNANIRELPSVAVPAHATHNDTAHAAAATVIATTAAETHVSATPDSETQKPETVTEAAEDHSHAAPEGHTVAATEEHPVASTEEHTAASTEEHGVSVVENPASPHEDDETF